MTIANNAAVNTAEDNVEEMTIIPVRVSVAAEIHAILDDIGSAYMKIGGLLAEAREDFEDQKAFLSWAEAEFSIKKAQVYKLMSVAKCFGEDKRFEGVAMRVMLALVPMADEAEVMEKAAALAEAGTLTTPAVNELLGKPAANVVKLVEGKQEDKLVEAGYTEDQAQAIVAASPERAVGLSPAMVAPYAPDVQAVEATPNPAPVSMQDATTQALLDQNKRLSEQLAEAMERIAALTSTRETKKATAPMLPQFKSKCLYARLGLSAEQATSKSAISKARRELVKIGYGEGHEAWNAINEAVEKLTDAAKDIASE